MAKLAPIYNDAQLINAIPATGAKVFTYAAGSSTKQATYTDITGTTPQANPIILNSRGEPASPIWLTEGQSYKFVFAPSTDSDPPVSPIRTIDNVTGVNDSSVTVDQWVVSGITPTYVSATQFTLPGDQTSAFQIGRRVKATVTAGTVYGTITASAFAALTTVTLSMDAGQVLDSGLSAVSYGIITTSPNSLPYALSASAIQAQTYTAFTTGGTSSAFTLTPTPAITANTANQAFFVKFNAAPTGSPTLAVSGQAALNVKYYDATGTKQFITSSVVPINWQSLVFNDGTDWVVMDTLPPSANSKIQPITASVAASALTITLNPTSLDFRSSSLTSGTVNTRTVSAAISVVVSSGSTLGTTSAQPSTLAVIAIDNAGTVELAVINLAGAIQLDESQLISTTAEGGAGAADSINVFYSTTARSNVPYRVVGFVTSTQATAGTWATAPSTIQGAGGNSLQNVGKVVSGVAQATTSGTSINFTGIPSTLRCLLFTLAGVSTSGTSAMQLQLGDSGGIENTGYVQSVAQGTAAFLSGTTGFALDTSSPAAAVNSGGILLVRVDNTTWAAFGITSEQTTPRVQTFSGYKTLTDTLDRLTLTTVIGTDTFDAGTVNWIGW